MPVWILVPFFNLGTTAGPGLKVAADRDKWLFVLNYDDPCVKLATIPVISVCPDL